MCPRSCHPIILNSELSVVRFLDISSNVNFSGKRDVDGRPPASFNRAIAIPHKTLVKKISELKRAWRSDLFDMFDDYSLVKFMGFELAVRE